MNLNIDEAGLRDILAGLKTSGFTRYADGIHYGWYLVFHGGMSEIFILFAGDERAGMVVRMGDSMLSYMLQEHRGKGLFRDWLDKYKNQIWPDVTDLIFGYDPHGDDD